jgi:hypothetical protein
MNRILSQTLFAYELYILIIHVNIFQFDSTFIFHLFHFNSVKG